MEINLDRRIVCAANLVAVEYGKTWPGNTWLTLVGPRHWDSTMHEQYQRFVETLPQPTKKIEDVQGFINTWGEFLTREQAWLVAEHNNQIIHRVGGDMVDGVGRLYSENLY